MPTLQELLEGGDLGGSEKTASAVSNQDLSGMDKIAMQLGLLGDLSTEKIAAEEKEEEKKEEEEEEEEEGYGGEKKASAGSLHALLFPNSVLSSSEKTAEEKQAAAEERLGAASYDRFAAAVSNFVEKLASEIISGNPHGDAQPNNRLPNNKPGDSEHAIDTTPSYTDEVKAKNDAKTVGQFQQKTAALAFRKHALLASLEQ